VLHLDNCYVIQLPIEMIYYYNLLRTVKINKINLISLINNTVRNTTNKYFVGYKRIKNHLRIYVIINLKYLILSYTGHVFKSISTKKN